MDSYDYQFQYIVQALQPHATAIAAHAQPQEALVHHMYDIISKYIDQIVDLPPNFLGKIVVCGTTTPLYRYCIPRPYLRYANAPS